MMRGTPRCRGATVVSYAIAGLSALLSALCYSEYAVDYRELSGSVFCPKQASTVKRGLPAAAMQLCPLTPGRIMPADSPS